MDLMETISVLNEKTARGSKAGRKKYTSKKGTKGRKVKSRKGRVRVYKSIMAALKAGNFGDIFSTDAADRVYVITKRKWGTDKDQKVGSKVAKGFTPGVATPKPGRWPQVKAYSIRTSARHSGRTSKRLEKKYGVGAKKDK